MNGWRDLTSGERIMLEEIYGDSLDLDRIQVRPSELMATSSALNAWGDPIFSPDVYVDDFSSSSTLYHVRETFLHEMAHSWQYQNGFQIPVISGIGSFLFNVFNNVWTIITGRPLETGYDRARSINYDQQSFTELGIEEQAELISLFLVGEVNDVPAGFIPIEGIDELQGQFGFGFTVENLSNLPAPLLEILIDGTAGDGTFKDSVRAQAEIIVATNNGQCFLAGTEITLADGSKKPIEQINPNDTVLSLNENGEMVPGQVVRTFKNEAKIILDFHGTFVTPGHVYWCAGGIYEGKFAPLIDILRDDGVVRHQDGTLIRAATGCEVGSDDDIELPVCLMGANEKGEEVIRAQKSLRLGTRWMLPDGRHFSMREYIDGLGMEVQPNGQLRSVETGETMPFIWVLSDTLPNPEDFVLARSQTSLEDIYRANEWESVQPTMASPMLVDANISSDQMPRNEPIALRSAELSSNSRKDIRQKLN